MEFQNSAAASPTSETAPETTPSSAAPEAVVSPPESVPPQSPDPLGNRSNDADTGATSRQEWLETSSVPDGVEEPSAGDDASSDSKVSVLPPDSAPATPAQAPVIVEEKEVVSGNSSFGENGGTSVDVDAGDNLASGGDIATEEQEVSGDVADVECGISSDGEAAALDGDDVVKDISKQNSETEENSQSGVVGVEEREVKEDSLTLESAGSREEHETHGIVQPEERDSPVIEGGTDLKDEQVEQSGSTDENVEDLDVGTTNLKPEEEVTAAPGVEKDGSKVQSKSNESESSVVEVRNTDSFGASKADGNIGDQEEPETAEAESEPVQEKEVEIAVGPDSKQNLDDAGPETNVVISEDVESNAAEGKTGTEVSAKDEVFDVVSKDVEPEVEGSADALGGKEGIEEHNAGLQEAGIDNLEVEASLKFDTASGVVAENVPVEEEDLLNDKVEPEPQKIHADFSEDASETNKDEDLPVVEAGEINSREIDSSEFLDIKENGIVEVTSAAENESSTTVGSQVVADDDDENRTHDETEEDEALASDGPARVAIIENSEAAKQMIQDMGEDSDEEVVSDEEGDGNELFDSAALTALLKAAAGSSPDGSVTLTSEDVTRIFSVDRPAGLGSTVPSLKAVPPRTIRSTTPSDLQIVGDEEIMDEEERKLHEKVDNIRVKFLRLVQRLKHSPEDTVAAQVLYRLGLAEGIKRGRQNSRVSNIKNAKRKALQLEADGNNDLDFSCNILVIGKAGVGKSATINSIFGEEKTHINAFEPATTSVKIISGVVDGVKIRVIDTPGLRASAMEQSANRKILSSIKKFTKKCPPDIVLYIDRLDSQTRDLNDMPLLRSITSTLASSIWFNAIVALTHAASAPPEGPNGTSLSYDVFVAQRSHVVQHLIRQAAGDMRLMNPVALVENHPSCRKNREGERVLPNGQSWRSQMLLLCYSSKILSEANSLLKLQDSSPAKLFGLRLRSPPLPFLLSSLLQSRAHPKLSPDQGGDNGDSDLELDDLSDADENEEDEYDQLPPFKPLRKAQISRLTKEQRRAYFEEYDYRVKLLQKKQLNEELKRMKEMKKRGKSGLDDLGYGDMTEDYDQDAAPASVPVPLPDMVLPPSFDSENPMYRYRFLEPTSQLLTRPVLDTHGWDHDCGYDGVSIEQTLALAGRYPVAATVQITKDKKDFSIHLDSSIAAKHGENGSTFAGFDVQPIARQLGYTLRGETKFKSFKKNKTTGGISVTFLGETVATGMKVEDQLSIGKRVTLVASTGAVRAQGDMAYGANLEARLRDKDFPIGQSLATLGLSLMRWRGDLALGANLQSQFSVGRNGKMAVHVGLNNKLSGQITVKTSTSEQLQIALIGILPIAASIFRSVWSGETNFTQ